MSDKLKTHKFARKPFYVDAVRVSEENMEKAAEWCGGEIQVSEAVPDMEVRGVVQPGTGTPEARYVKVKVHRPLTDRQSMAFIGDWILFAGTGFKVYTPKAFDKSFEKVRTLTKAQADEAGITVPHEPSQKPTFTNDEEGVTAEPTVIPPRPKDSVDRLLDEISRP